MFAFIWDGLVWILPVVLILLSYVTGDLIQILFQVKKGVAFKVLSGFVVLLCLFHLTSLLFMYRPWPFSTLYLLFLGELAAVLLAYLIFSILRRRIPLKEDLVTLGKRAREIAVHNWWQLILWAAVLFLILWQVSRVILHVAYNIDDNFYIAESVTFLSRDRLMDVLPSSGIPGSVFPATYLLVSWETFLAALSKLFQTSPAVLCHSLLPAFLIPLHYMAYYLAGREIVRFRTPMFLLFVLLLNFTCGPSTYDQGAFLTLRIWQGKAVLVNLLLPLFLYAFLRIIKTAKVSLANILFLFCLLLASQAATTVGTYLSPVLYAVYAVSFLLICRKWKQFFKLLIPAAGILPFVLLKVWTLLNAGTLDELSEGTGVYDRSFTELSMNYFGFSLIPLFFLLALIILGVRLKEGPEKPLRFFFAISSGLLILFFLNPLVMPFAERFITGTGVYWRLFWLLQITLVIAAGFALFTGIPRLRLSKVTVLLFLSIAVLLSGRSIFLDEDVKDGFQNPAKVSETTQMIAASVQADLALTHPQLSENELKEKAQETILLLPRTLSVELRQIEDISLIYYPYYSNNYYAYQTDEEFALLQGLYNTLYRKKTWKAKELFDSVSLLGIDYVAIGTGTAKANKYQIPDLFQPVYSGKGYTLYKTNGGS